MGGISLILFTSSTTGQGIPEPDLVLYGVVKNVQSNANLRLGHGTLTWIFQPVGGGAAITASTTLTNINEEFSYILRIPCETPVAGFPTSTNRILLTPGAITFDRSQVSWNSNQLTFVQASQTNTTFGAPDRGRLERVDLDVSAPIVFDANGLPLDWERMYFGYTGVDPFADPDQDGMTTEEEYRAGTNPNEFVSGLRITEIAPDNGGVRLKWTSVIYKSYALQRSSSAGGGYVDVQTGITATAPTNTFLDTNLSTAGPWFYRLRLDEGTAIAIPLRLQNLREDEAGGLRMDWLSEANKTYAIQRSSNLTTGFTDVHISLPATPPLNSYWDSNALGTGPYFYRLRLQQ